MVILESFLNRVDFERVMLNKTTTIVDVPEFGLRIAYTGTVERQWKGPNVITNVTRYEVAAVGLLGKNDPETLEPVGSIRDLLETGTQPELQQRLGDLMRTGLERQYEFEHNGLNRLQWRKRGRTLATLAEAVNTSFGPYIAKPAPHREYI